MAVPVKAPDTAPRFPRWRTEFKKANLRELTADMVTPSWAPGEARPRLISRSGFEQRHIYTSQIASG